MIITLLLKNQGFYSILFFVLNHYLYCRKNKLNYKMNTDNWLFKSVNGWTDYFKNVELNYETDTSTDVQYYDQRNTILDNFTLNEYRTAIKEMYLYNEITQKKIQEIKEKYNLLNNYSSIFIRRGDKLADESNYYHAKEYIDLLLQKEPNCKRIFLQTDDYNSVIEARQYITMNNLNIEIITICNENTKGMVIVQNPHQTLYNIYNNNYYSKNKNYLVDNKKSIESFKPVYQMNSDELYNHTLEMLIGIDIVLYSNTCVLDYESNISRFIKISHSNPNNVFDINKQYIDFENIVFPAYGF